MLVDKDKNSILVVVGETSGDYLASSILKLFKKKNIAYWGTGGNKMKALGIEILYPIQSLEIIGSEIFRKFFFIKKVANNLVEECKKRNTKIAILVDYPGFNLWLARKLHPLGIKCYMIVSPQIWAWRYNRIYKIKKYIQAVLCLFDFEVDIYKKENIPAFFIGHPLIQESLNKRDLLKKSKNNKKVILLLPGSRKREVAYHLPHLLQIANEFPQYQYILPVAHVEIKELILKQYSLTKNISLQLGGLHSALSIAHAAIACSGTVTLECSMFQVPYILIYKTSRFAYSIGKYLVRVKYLGIINILCNREVVKEYIQNDIKIEKMLKEVNLLLHNKEYRNKIKKSFQQVEHKYKNKNPSLEASNILRSITGL